MAHFDADAFLDAMEPPSLVLGGRRHVGRHLSAAEWMKAMAAIDVAQTKGSMTAYAAVARIVFGAMYDRPWWQVWKPRVSTALLSQPPAVWQMALQTFFASPATGVRMGTMTMPTPDESPATPSPTGPAPSPPSSASTAGDAGTPPATGGPGTG